MGLNLRRDNTYISFSVHLGRLVDRASCSCPCVRHTPSISYSLPCPHTLYSWLRSHPHPHTPSIAFRHLPPNLLQNWLRHWRGTLCLRAAVHRCCRCSPKGLVTNKTVGSSIASKHARRHEARPPRVEEKSSVSIQTTLILSVLAKASWTVIKEKLI